MSSSFIERKKQTQQFKQLLVDYENNKHDLTYSKGIYLFGESGTGKSTFVRSLLKELDYDIIYYDAGDIRNKSIIDTITKHNMSNVNILSMFHRQHKKIAIVMDEIDGMNNGDRGGINAIIKIVRPKKTKKQKLEDTSINPIICIGNKHADKKINELIDVCKSMELQKPVNEDIYNIIDSIMVGISTSVKHKIVNHIQSDLRKLDTFLTIYSNNKADINDKIFNDILHIKSYNNDTKQITKSLIYNNYSFREHSTIMNETDRTIVGLLWHENIIDQLQKIPKNISVPLYLTILNNISIADYIDRITFQKQIWQFNELSSIIKTFTNNFIFHKTFNKKINVGDIRFTKVLTKYSTEYNNSLFIQNLCLMLDMDKKDIHQFFFHIQATEDNKLENFIIENYDFGKLDLNRMYKYLGKYTTYIN
jgi:hypothetical protein